MDCKISTDARNIKLHSLLSDWYLHFILFSGYSDFDYEGQEGGEQAPSRLEIKTIAQKLVAQKMGKKKRKEKSN